MHKKTILELHDDLKNERITPLALANSSLQHMQEINDKINSVNSYCKFEVSGIKIDNYLSGIPYAMKDLIATKDFLTTSSSAFLEEFIPQYSATIYERFLDKNALMVCKSNLDEYGMGGTNLNSIYGMTHNPYNLDKGTAGSSGGSAALVAAGCVPFAIGSDTGDSARKPAAYCGVYGYKPTWSLISRYGVFPYGSSLDQVGVLARCVDDIAIVVESLNGPDLHDTTTLNNKKLMLFENLETNTKPLKIGYVKELIETFDDEFVIKQFEETIEYLKSLNHKIVELSVPLNLLKCVRGCYHTFANSEASSNLGNLTGIGFGKRVESTNFKESIIETRSEGLSKYSKARLLIGALALKECNCDKYYDQACRIRNLIVQEFEKVFNDVDIVFAPSANSGARHPINDINTASELSNLVGDNDLIIANLIGSPSIVIPTHLHEQLPYAMSFMAKPFDDQLLLNFSKQFEANLLNKDYLNLTSFYNRYVKEIG